jgi:hypothetical protein
MICYARARAIRKVKDVANMLIANSLAQSRAYPPEEKLGGQLHSLIKDPKSCLSAVASVDSEAAQILQFYASGYATLRRFYEIRDEPVLAKEGQTPRLRPLARKKASADALVAVIRSSADSIYGGLYDRERDSAVLVDGLLVLLGEALVFVDGETLPPKLTHTIKYQSTTESSSSILTVFQQSAILAAIEDLETVNPRVFAACEEFFRKTLDEYRREKGISPSASFAPPASFSKQTSLLTASSSSFSMVGSEMLGSTGIRSDSASGILVARPNTNDYSAPIKRGWDWRAGLASAPAEDEKAEDVLKILRLRLAKAMAWR